KMKVNTVALLFILLFSSSIELISQQMERERANKLISFLYQNNNEILSMALIELADSNVVAAIPGIVENIWHYDQFRRYLAARALYKLNYASAHEIILAYVDSVEQGKDYTRFSKLSLQSMANNLLFAMGDYSKYQNTINYVKSILPEVEANDIYSLEKIIKEIPTEKYNIKQVLEIIALNSSISMTRWVASHSLSDNYGLEAISTVISVFENDSDWTNRGMIVDKLFKNFSDSLIHISLLKQIKLEKNPQNICVISEELLSKYGYLTDYYKVKNCYAQISDSVFYKYVREVLLDNFVVKKPEIASTRLSNIDSLYAYHTQSIFLNWLGNSAFSDQLKTYLTEAKTKLASGDSLGAALKIKLYQNQIVEQFKDTVTTDGKYVTEDGFKFLYYYPKYILERLPKLPTVKFNDSQGKLINSGTLQFYEGSWKDAVNNNDGTFTVPTTQKTLSLRMNYAYGSQTKSNVTVGADTVVFQTVNTQVKLLDSKGAILDTGRVQYYSGAWRDFGVTSNGVAVKELLPNNYSFRMNYAFASKDKTQDVGTNNVVVFQTVPATVQLKNSLGNPMPAPLGDAGTVQYYSGAWREFSATSNGVAVKELLPNNYSFRMNYAFASKDKAQDISTNNTVVFQTVPATVQLKNSSSELMPAPLGDAGTVQYYSGAWRDFGATTNGVAVKELLPNNYSFRMNYAFASKDKAQDISTNNVVIFQTVPAMVQLKNSNGSLMDAGTVQYYSGAWREFGATTNGVTVKELLPNNYSFRMTHEFVSLDKTQNTETNNVIVFNTVLCNVNVLDAQNQPVNNAAVSYYSGAWRSIGATLNGTISKELLPVNLSFRAVSGTKQLNKTQNIGTNNNVEIKLP
ncbi:MAG: Alpha beta-propellor repeat-containing integrin, partial [Stygiobacter sp.]